MTFIDAVKAAFDSLVRTYSPMIIGAVLAGLALIMGPVTVPDEVLTLVTLVVALIFQMLWYGIIRIVELVRGRASVLLGLGIVKADPVYVPVVKTSPEYVAELDAIADAADQANAARTRESAAAPVPEV